ncbi:MAG: XrtA system polysaccharide deacetylase [Acetobacteraceae bacterium]
MTGSARHALSVDVEDWFQVQAFAGVIARADWDRLPRRVVANTDRLLDLFAQHGVSATFFVLGWVAERHPDLVRRIAAGGHELASHGHGHELVHAIGPDAFRADIRRAKALIEDAAGTPVRGYRAPTFSIGRRTTPWAHAILAEEGHGYSSSVYPVRHDLYGDPEAPQAPFRPDPAGVVEIPMTVSRLGGRAVPCSGGGWFRILPYPLFAALLRRAAATAPAVFYTHPWEIDAAQPRLGAAPLKSRFRHYTGLKRTEPRLRRLLADFAWGRMDQVFAASLAP